MSITDWATLVNIILHILNEFRISIANGSEAIDSDLAVSSSDSVKDDIIWHEQSILINTISQ